MLRMNNIFADVLNEASFSIVEYVDEYADGQRSEAWFEKRRGRWTGSRLTDLMSKGRGKSLWGEKAKAYMFSRFIERLRGTPDTQISQTRDMRRGEELEPYAIAAFEKQYPEYIVELADFILFPNCETAGASPDGIVKLRATGEVVGVFETKARRDGTTYSHAYERVYEKHPDFWQLTGEMVAVGTDTAFYCHYSDLHEEPFDLQVQIVKLSNDHVLDLYDRIDDAEDILKGAFDIVGDIKGLRPHELTERIIESKNFIYSR